MWHEWVHSCAWMTFWTRQQQQHHSGGQELDHLICFLYNTEPERERKKRAWMHCQALPWCCSCNKKLYNRHLVARVAVVSFEKSPLEGSSCAVKGPLMSRRACGKLHLSAWMCPNIAACHAVITVAKLICFLSIPCACLLKVDAE